jgi:penicillin-binding protein 2
MIEPLDPRTPPMTPQLALRVAIVGGIALVMFALIFFRLWFLQVLSGSQYAADAQGNITRSVPVAAPRGEILASDGSILVGSTPVPAVQIEPPDLRPTPLTYENFQKDIGQDDALFNRLAKVLRMSTKPEPCQYTIYVTKSKRFPEGYVIHDPKLAQIPCLITQSIANEAYANVTIKTDVTPDVQAYLAERQLDFPGVSAEQPVYVRDYPHDTLGAQMFGTIGPISALERAIEAKGDGFKGAKATDVVGQSGLEYEYDQYLLGVDGTERVKVNAANQFEGYANETAPTPGYNLKTWIDLKLQKVGEAALAESIAKNSGAGADGGAFVAMNPVNGEIYAMGSNPTYPPRELAHPISQATYNTDFLSPSANDPLLNRAIGTALPNGSTFKVITATAALERGVWGVDEPYDDIGEFCYPGEDPKLPGSCIHNSGGEAQGPITLEKAIQVSDDVYFYNLGYRLNGVTPPATDPNGGVLQEWARQFGIGRSTGVDLPGESSGTLPTPNYLLARYHEEVQCETATGDYAYTNGQGLTSSTKLPGYHRSPKHPASKGGCGIASPVYSNDVWTVGDNVESGVGQGDDQVTPMQLAVVYAAIENGGKIVAPHIGEDIESSEGTILQQLNPAIKRTLKINPDYLDAIRQGLHLAAQSAGGTSDDVMGNFPEPVYGKTGTAQEGTAAAINSHTETDYSWYAAYVPSKTKPIVVIVSVEKGGFGDVAAAPVARQILSQWFLGKAGPYVVGSSTSKNTT